MHHARARLTALALLAALAAGCKPAAAQPDPAAVLHPRTSARAELPCGRSDVERCPPAASGSPATTLAEPGYVPKPAGPPPTAAARR
jgi:hypothetical protein